MFLSGKRPASGNASGQDACMAHACIPRKPKRCIHTTCSQELNDINARTPGSDTTTRFSRGHRILSRTFAFLGCPS